MSKKRDLALWEDQPEKPGPGRLLLLTSWQLMASPRDEQV